MMKRFLVITLAGITLAGCANTSTLSGDVYSASEAKQVQTVTYGTVVSTRPVQIQAGEDSNIIGTLGGAVLGGLVGNTVGRGTGRNLATAAGAVAGGVAGNSIEGAVNRVQGVELEIRKDDGSTIMVIQKQGDTKFHAGQRVAMASNGRAITVSPR
ncbi:glycine zipper 2TM domain-containing protein [Dickeya undicola]|uniref:Glycine zipper 2TM domain-containing protein n=1 Tax=Dickeya undicola TaxID=1577887 RepID=A0A3N0G5G0_9GAMM|nr:glycine zipper 2TM domain-containing protein [Dickeya undicola]RNM07496.1 glycine zipper 2TM domain-containing protein [Dickeya undicola]RNM26531.1 glycine zipper 2TM domain-containing protein [Dickeya undicola]